MTREEIVSLLDRRQAAAERRDAAALAALYAPDSTVQSLMAGTVTGREAIEEIYVEWFRAFPDVTSSVEAILIDGSEVALVSRHVGTDMGGFMGMKPTGKPFRLTLVHLLTVRDGQIVRERRIYDFTGLLVQVGVLKAKPA